MFGAWCALPKKTWERKMSLLSKKKWSTHFSICETDPPQKNTLNSSIYCTIHSPSLHHSKTNFTRFFFRLRHIQQQQLRPCQRPETWDWSGFCCLARNQKTHFRESCPTFVILTNKFASHGRCRSWDIARNYLPNLLPLGSYICTWGVIASPRFLWHSFCNNHGGKWPCSKPICTF